VLRRWQGGRVRGDRGFPLADQHCTLPSDMKDDRSDLAIPRKGEGGKMGWGVCTRTCFSARVGSGTEDNRVWS
jgi:hypothetical protein